MLPFQGKDGDSISLGTTKTKNMSTKIGGCVRRVQEDGTIKWFFYLTLEGHRLMREEI